MKNTNLDRVRELLAANSFKPETQKLVLYGENNVIFTGTLNRFKFYI